ncbi:Amino acid/auxin permease, partial [Globisporangium splendens]
MALNEVSTLLQHTNDEVQGAIAKAKAPAHGQQGSAVSSFLGLATTMMGACILTLPGTVEAVGVAPAILIFLVAGWITYQSFEMITIACDATNEFSYESLSSRLFGATGVWAVRLLTLILLFGSVVMYMVIAMDLFEPFLVGHLSRSAIGLVFTVVAIPLCLPETIHELRYMNMLVILCVLYILFALTVRTIQNDPEFAATIKPNASSEFNSEAAAIAYALPIISLSFACQLNVPRAYDEIHDKQAMKHVHQALVVAGLVIYILFAVLGYVCFHGHPPSDILTGFRTDDTLINGARLCLGASMVLKTPMTFQPLRQAVELTFLGHDRESLPFRTAITTFFMFFAHLLSVTSKDLGVVMSFMGALAGNLLTITIPGLFLYEVGHSYLYDNSAFYNRRLALLFTFTGVVFSIVSLTYLGYNTIVN